MKLGEGGRGEVGGEGVEESPSLFMMKQRW